MDKTNGREMIPRKKLLRKYVEVLLEQTEAFPVVEKLASSSSLLSAEVVRACPVDKDPVVEVIIVGLGKQMKKPEFGTSSKEMGKSRSHTLSKVDSKVEAREWGEVEKPAEAEVEAPKDAEMEVGTSGGAS